MIYAQTASTENSTASQPLRIISAARLKSGATSSASLMIFQMYQNGISVRTALTAASSQERYVSSLWLPA